MNFLFVSSKNRREYAYGPKHVRLRPCPRRQLQAVVPLFQAVLSTVSYLGTVVLLFMSKIFFAEFYKIYIIGIVSTSRSQISQNLNLILNISHESKENNYEHQTSIHHNLVKSQPIFMNFMSEFSVSKDLQDYMHKRKN